MGLHDVMIMTIEAPRHTWKWLLRTIHDNGIDTPGLQEWTKQVELGIPYHKVAATMLALEDLRDEFCLCSQLQCRTCQLIDRISSSVEV